MNDSFGGDFNATQGANVGAVSEQKAEGIAPVFIKQVQESPEGNFQLFGMSFGMVCCVTIVRNIETSSTKITYSLEDHTGEIEAHYWLEEGDTLKAPDVMLNNYVKVFGSMRTTGGQKTLMIFKMLPITDPNEITTHVLEVLNARYKAEDFGNKGSGGSGLGDFGVGSKAGVGNGNLDGGNDLGLEGKHRAVFQAIRSHVSDEGISRKELQRKFAHLSTSELDNILDFMISEGHIYSSIDPDHFLSTE